MRIIPAMSNMGSLIVLAAAAGLAGCASAGSSLDGVDGGGGGGVDAGTSDAPTGTVDAPQVTPADAPAPCTVMTRNLLTNENFDMTPIGTGWVEAPINAMYPIITADGTLVQSLPNKAWLGGIAQAASDSLYQDVMIPASTTSLVLTGYYEIRTGELPIFAFDRGTVELTTPTGTPLQQVLALDNRDATTGWTAINHTFTSPHAGQTVRLRLGTTSDATNPTSFFFDSLALTATYCE